MTISTGTYVGNGGKQRITLCFRPDMVLAIPEGALHVGLKIPELWAGRSNVLSATDSYISGCTFSAKGFAIGSSDRWNADGVTYHYVALARSAALPMSLVGSQGNGVIGRAMKLADAFTPVAVMCKRDSSRDGVLQVGTEKTAVLGGSEAPVVAIEGLAPGGFTVNWHGYVNEYYAAGELGEGTEFVAFGAGAAIAAVAYTGTGAAQTVDLGFSPRFVLVGRSLGAAMVGVIKTDTMAADVGKPVNATAAAACGLTLSPPGLTLSADSGLNASGSRYVVLAVGPHEDGPIPAPAVQSRHRSAILLPGRTVSSWIDCGTDDSLVIDGPITLEWMGAIEPVWRGMPVPMMWRGNAVTDTAGSCSLALYAQSYLGSPGNWSGPLLCVGCSDRLSLDVHSTDIRKSWRTGIIPTYGRVTHWMATHNGSGGWLLYRDGRLIRQRDINVVSDGGYPNIDGVSGHRMIFGAMHDGSAPAYFQRQRMMLARIYNRALTASEVAARFARAGLRSGEGDVTSGLAEEWDAINASGSVLPATVASANNGAIHGGSIIRL